MTYDMVIDNLNYFSNENTIDELVLSGGEPLEMNFLPCICDYANSIPVKSIYLHSRGGKLLYDRLNDLEKFINRVMISYQTIGGHDNLSDELIKTILKSNIEIRTNTVLLKHNYKHIYDIILHLAALGVRRFLISYPFPLGKTSVISNNNLLIDSKKIYDVIKGVSEYCERNNLTITFQGFPKCFLKPYQQLQDVWEERFLVDYYHQKKEKLLLFQELLGIDYSELCQQCNELENCNGVWVNSWHNEVFKLEPFI
jgi:MoaA/NifB/PqqE/SkfB family radical SAM enzyme